MSDPLDLEIIVNLWYVRDKEGVIYSLRAKPYVMSGRDEQKMDFLAERAKTDFLIAQPFPFPHRYSTTVIEGGERKDFPVAFAGMFLSAGEMTNLFEDVFVALNDQLPAQTFLEIGNDPMVCITALLGDDTGFARLYSSDKSNSMKQMTR